MDPLASFPTPPDAARTEWMNGNFLKLHPGPPVHYFLACEDEEYHTHPFEFTSHVIVGGYREQVLVPVAGGGWEVRTYERRPDTSHTMPLSTPHKLVGLLAGPCITRCEYGPTTHKPGFCRLEADGQLWHRYHDEADWRPYPMPA